MHCAEARELADVSSGRAMDDDITRHLSQHLDACPACRTEVAMQRALRDSLKGAFERDEALQARPEFVSGLAAALRARAEAQEKRARSHWLPAALVAAAALCVLAVGIGGARDIASARRFETLARAAVGDHQACVVNFKPGRRPMSLAEAGRRFEPFYSALQTVTPAASDDGDPVTVLGRHACMFNGRRFAHVVVRYRGALGSVLVTKSSDVHVRSAVMRLNGLWLVSFPASDRAVFVVCPLDQGESRELAQAFERPVTKALAGF